MTAVAAVTVGLGAGLVAVGTYGVVARRDALGQLVGLALGFSGAVLGAAGFGLADPQRRSVGEVLGLVVLLLATALLGAGSALAAVARRRGAESAAEPAPEPSGVDQGAA